MGGAFGLGVILILAALAAPVAAHAGGLLGANKFDLLEQYLGYASNGDGSPAYVKVTRAMARKAILDARDAGFGFLRVSVSGYRPIGPGDTTKDVLPLWRADPEALWRAVDAMCDDLDAAGLRLVPTLNWNYVQFPALAGETTAAFIGDPQSASRALAARFIADFAARTRARHTILFDELTNEFNLLADLDLQRRCRREHGDVPVWCGAVGNFSSAALDGFARDMAATVHRADPGRRLSSGYALPRPGETHLARHPEFLPGGPDWTADSAAEFERVLATSQQAFDVVSIHAYAGDRRFGDSGEADLVRRAGKVVHGLGKALFVGEFGAPDATPFARDLLRTLAAGEADYAAVWVWEFYQRSTFSVAEGTATNASVEPGLHDGFLSLLKRPGEAAAAPRVVLTWPLPCARIDRPVMLAAVASEGAGVPASVAFLVDGGLVGEATAPPYRVMFDPQGREAKPVTIEARAVGRSGGTASDGEVVMLNGGGLCRVG